MLYLATSPWVSCHIVCRKPLPVRVSTSDVASLATTVGSFVDCINKELASSTWECPSYAQIRGRGAWGLVVVVADIRVSIAAIITRSTARAILFTASSVFESTITSKTLSGLPSQQAAILLWEILSAYHKLIKTVFTDTNSLHRSSKFRFIRGNQLIVSTVMVVPSRILEVGGSIWPRTTGTFSTFTIVTEISTTTSTTVLFQNGFGACLLWHVLIWISKT